MARAFRYFIAALLIPPVCGMIVACTSTSSVSDRLDDAKQAMYERDQISSELRQHIYGAERALEDSRDKEANAEENPDEAERYREEAKKNLREADIELMEAENILHQSILTTHNHRANFFLLVYDKRTHNDGRESKELKVQISKKLKVPGEIPLYGGYTQKIFWQIFDADRGQAVRESNSSFEVFFFFDIPICCELKKSISVSQGIESESNAGSSAFINNEGREVNTKRSWNRIYLNLTYNTYRSQRILRSGIDSKSKVKQIPAIH